MQERHERELQQRVRDVDRDREPEPFLTEREQAQRQTEVAGVAERQRRQERALRQAQQLDQHGGHGRHAERDDDHRADHLPELRERQRELRQAREHEARSRDVHDDARHERHVERRAGQTPAVADRSHDEHRRENGGNFGDHERSHGCVRYGLRGRRRRPEVCQNGAPKSHARNRGPSMLGQFLEYSVAARPLAASFEFFRVARLHEHSGQRHAAGSLPRLLRRRHRGRPPRPRASGPAADVRAAGAPRLRAPATPRSASSSRDEHLRDNEFNSIGFTDPGGQEVVLIEARTFPPGGWDAHNVAICGEFFEVTLPANEPRRVEPLLAGAWVRARRLRRGAAPLATARRARHRPRACTRRTACPGLSFRCRRLAGAPRVPARERIVRARRHADRGSRATVGDARRRPRARSSICSRRARSERRCVSAGAIDLGERVAQARVQRARAREVRQQVLHLIREHAAALQIDVLGIRRRERHGDELEPRLFRRAAALVVVAAAAGRHDVGPDVARRRG